jgi:hypothetical protein
MLFRAVLGSEIKLEVEPTVYPAAIHSDLRGCASLGSRIYGKVMLLII